MRLARRARSPCLECASSRRIQFLPLRHRVLTGVYQQDSPSMLPQATHAKFVLDSSPVISTPELVGMKRLDLHGNVVAWFAPQDMNVLIVCRRRTHREASRHGYDRT
jgi:hypothetical protein